MGVAVCANQRICLDVGAFLVAVVTSISHVPKVALYPSVATLCGIM